MRFSLSLDEKTGWRIKRLAALEKVSVNALMSRVLGEYCEKYADKLAKLQAAETSAFQAVQLDKLTKIKFATFEVYNDGKKIKGETGITASVNDFDVICYSLPLSGDDFSKLFNFVTEFVPIIFENGGRYDTEISNNRVTLIIGKEKFSIEFSTPDAATIFEKYLDDLTSKAVKAAILGQLIPKMEKNQYEDEDEN